MDFRMIYVLLYDQLMILEIGSQIIFGNAFLVQK